MTRLVTSTSASLPRTKAGEQPTAKPIEAHLQHLFISHGTYAHLLILDIEHILHLADDIERARRQFRQATRKIMLPLAKCRSVPESVLLLTAIVASRVILDHLLNEIASVSRARLAAIRVSLKKQLSAVTAFC